MAWVANTAEAAASWVAETAEASVSWLAETAEGEDSVCVVGGGDSVGNGVVAWVVNTAEVTASWVVETAEALAAKSDNLMIVCCKGSKKNGAKASKHAVTSGQEPGQFYPPTRRYQFPNGFAPSLGDKPRRAAETLISKILRLVSRNVHVLRNIFISRVDFHHTRTSFFML